MDIEKLHSDLVSAITTALDKHRDVFESETIACLAIDIHPYNSFLSLCMRIDTDEQDVPWVSDWKYSQFANVNNWPEGSELADRLRHAYEKLREIGPQSGSDGTFCWPFFMAAGRALNAPEVTQWLETLNQTTDFLCFVGDPDDMGRTDPPFNFCLLAQAFEKVE